MSLLFLFLGCIGQEDCTLEARVSVVVDLFDESGQQITEGDVTYTPSGDEEQDCEQVQDSFHCGWEVSGEILIQAQTTVNGPAMGEETVNVSKGPCHVVSENLDLTLISYDCTDEEVPSVIVTVKDGWGELVAGAEVTYDPKDSGWEFPESCEPYSKGQYLCGYEIAGYINIWAEHPTSGFAYQQVFVDNDLCHVITQNVELKLSEAQ